MKPILSGIFVTFFVGTAIIIGQAGQAQTTAAKPKISAAAILDKYVEATGGKAAYARVKSTVSK